MRRANRASRELHSSGNEMLVRSVSLLRCDSRGVLCSEGMRIMPKVNVLGFI